MFDKIKQAGQMAKAVKQARDLQKQMSAEEVVVEEGSIKVVVDGTMQIKQFVVNGVENDQVVKVLNKAMHKAQEVMAKKMQDMAGGLGGLMSMMGK